MPSPGSKHGPWAFAVAQGLKTMAKCERAVGLSAWVMRVSKAGCRAKSSAFSSSVLPQEAELDTDVVNICVAFRFPFPKLVLHAQAQFDCSGLVGLHHAGFGNHPRCCIADARKNVETFTSWLQGVAVRYARRVLSGRSA